MNDTFAKDAQVGAVHECSNGARTPAHAPGRIAPAGSRPERVQVCTNFCGQHSGEFVDGLFSMESCNTTYFL